MFIYLNPSWEPFLNGYIMRGVACFYAGVLLCEINDYLPQEQKEQFAWKSLCALVVFRAALHFSPYSFWDNERYGQIGLIVLQWPILIFAAINWRRFRTVLEVKPLLYLGKISMDVYLWHIPVQITIKSLDSMLGLSINYGSKVIWVIYIAATMAVANMSHYLFSKAKKQHYFLKAAVALVCCVALLFVTEITGTHMKAVLDNSLSYTDQSSTVVLESGTECSEDFCPDRSGYVQKIQFYAITWNKAYANDQKIIVRVVDKETDEVLASADRWIRNLKDGQVAEIAFENKPYLEQDHMYSLVFETNTTADQEAMALLLTRNSKNLQTAEVNHCSVDEHISAKVYVRK